MAGDGLSRDPKLAAWLIATRRGIERAMTARLGPRAPAPGDPEAEALRRFRAYAASSLQRGKPAAPSLDGVRPQEARLSAVLDAWTDAAADMAGGRGEAVRGALAPLVQRFREALRQGGTARRRSGAPRAGRRAVPAAIDRVADGFLAIDVDTRLIVDANPAVGALLDVRRDALVGTETADVIPRAVDEQWWTELDAIAEGDEVRRFIAELRDARGGRIRMEASATRWSTRTRTLALVVLRPAPGL